MGKKFLAGLTLGSLAGLAAWTSLDDKQQSLIKAKVKATAFETMDVVTDYALNALDIADAMVHDYGENAVDKMSDITDLVKNKKDEFAGHFVSDNFDEETADLRAALKDAKDDDNDDILIDQTQKEDK
ncbi:hypothetical protein [Limosilactobacillus coleohominis]|uniref:YtxH domain-containing protein n=1 Tax=Limosilactobacillus coleohominis TaxID=181675 RepID=A0ABS2GXX6_9LACO|nr:hypothetical protein [Limosilactobacillus coleohominis]MBM6940181.1 hypothetical protein [Limosilactobacillus coleohominis]